MMYTGCVDEGDASLLVVLCVARAKEIENFNFYQICAILKRHHRTQHEFPNETCCLD